MLFSEEYLRLSLELLTCLLIVVLASYYASAKEKNYFPSPPGIPVIGHLLQIPTLSPWLKLARWGRTFGLSSINVFAVLYLNSRTNQKSLNLLGDIIYVQFLGRPVIILNGAETTHELLDLRGGNFSDRPITIYHGEM